MVLFVHMTQMVKLMVKQIDDRDDESEGQAIDEMPPLVDETEV